MRQQLREVIRNPFADPVEDNGAVLVVEHVTHPDEQMQGDLRGAFARVVRAAPLRR